VLLLLRRRARVVSCGTVDGCAVIQHQVLSFRDLRRLQNSAAAIEGFLAHAKKD